MILLLLLLILAVVTGTLGFVIKGAFWLLILAALFFVASYFAHATRGHNR